MGQLGTEDQSLSFEVVYDVTQTLGIPWLLVLPIAVVIVISAVGLRYYIKKRDFRGTVAFLLVAMCATSVALIVIAATVLPNLHQRHLLKAGEFSISVGLVEDFHPMPTGGHDTERFTVDGTKFEYSDYFLGSGFNRTASRGGPIREGLHVRITHKDGVILRLEVADEEH